MTLRSNKLSNDRGLDGRGAFRRISAWCCVGLCLTILAVAGCSGKDQPSIVVYTALDREFSEPILQRFEDQTGIRVLAKYDTESTKTVGLANAIIQERNRPRCDVFWNNEVLHTLRLEKLGLLERYAAAGADNFPAQYRSADGLWYGLAARIRVLLVNTELVSAEQMPSSIDDLVDPKWQGQVGVAKPLFGTTATHAAVLVDRWGLERADKFFRDLEQNAQVLSGNKQVAVAVGKGQLAFGLTDTDDAIIERDNGRPVAIVFPDQGESGSGALFIPNTVAVIKGSKNQSAAGVLIDFLLSPAVEIALAKGQSAQFPLNSQVTEPSRAQPDFPIKHLDADFGNAADRWDETADRLKAIFHGE